MHRTQTYPAKLSPSVHTRLSAFLEQQRLLYNAALEERSGAYQAADRPATTLVGRQERGQESSEAQAHTGEGVAAGAGTGAGPTA